MVYACLGVICRVHFWLGSFMRHCGNTGWNGHWIKLTLERKIFSLLLPWFELAIFWSQVRCCHQQFIPAVDVRWPGERLPWWGTTLMKDHPDVRPPCWEITLMRDHLGKRPPCWETFLMRDHLDKRPSWWKTTLMKDHSDERPPWWDERSPW